MLQLCLLYTSLSICRPFNGFDWLFAVPTNTMGRNGTWLLLNLNQLMPDVAFRAGMNLLIRYCKHMTIFGVSTGEIFSLFIYSVMLIAVGEAVH